MIIFNAADVAYANFCLKTGPSKKKYMRMIMAKALQSLLSCTLNVVRL